MRLWADASRAQRFSAVRGGAAHLDAVARLKDWTRERFSLTDEAAVMVSEGGPSFPGCPPVETLVVFSTAEGRSFHFRVFKPAEEVAVDDIPPAWMREALTGMPGLGCSCC